MGAARTVVARVTAGESGEGDGGGRGTAERAAGLEELLVPPGQAGDAAATCTAARAAVTVGQMAAEAETGWRAEVLVRETALAVGEEGTSPLAPDAATPHHLRPRRATLALGIRPWPVCDSTIRVTSLGAPRRGVSTFPIKAVAAAVKAAEVTEAAREAVRVVKAAWEAAWAVETIGVACKAARVVRRSGRYCTELRAPVTVIVAAVRAKKATDAELLGSPTTANMAVAVKEAAAACEAAASTKNPRSCALANGSHVAHHHSKTTCDGKGCRHHPKRNKQSEPESEPVRPPPTAVAMPARGAMAAKGAMAVKEAAAALIDRRLHSAQAAVPFVETNLKADKTVCARAFCLCGSGRRAARS